jgi:sugar fermentation stimulation protein A
MFYPYPKLYPGVLIKRYKRFMADIELDSGETITAHCPNTGPMTGVSLPGSRVYVSHSNNPNRKLAYTWELIEVHDHEPTWVGINTSLPNRVVKQLLKEHSLPELGPYQKIQTEVTYGQERSRVDFRLTGKEGQKEIYLEVKNTTWAKQRLALFPDTVTTRGQKHLRELTGLLPDARAVILYFINRADCSHFAPGDEADPHYGQLLRQAIAAGLEVLPCRFEVSPDGVRYANLATLVLSA